MVCFIPLQVQKYLNCKSQVLHTYIQIILKIFLKPFRGFVVIFVVEPERSDCKIWKCLIRPGNE